LPGVKAHLEALPNGARLGKYIEKRTAHGTVERADRERKDVEGRSNLLTIFRVRLVEETFRGKEIGRREGSR